MKKYIVLISFLGAFCAFGQSKGSEFGFHLSENDGDFGFGLNYTTPYLFNESIAISTRANMMYFRYNKTGEMEMTPYYNVQIGVLGHKSKISENILLYGEGGVLALLPSSKFSDSDLEFGGYGLFGFEFHFDSHNSYFIEMGGMGTGATANQLFGNPIYSNGFMVNVGYKITLTKHNN